MCEDVYGVFMKNLQTLAAKCLDLAKSEHLVLEPFVVGGKMDVAAINEKTSSPTACDFKNAWGTLVNDDEIRKNFEERFNIPKYDFLSLFFDKTFADHGETFSSISLCRDKVCEISAARALARPLKNAETREDAIAKTRSVIQSLGGDLPPTLGLLFSAHAL